MLGCWPKRESESRRFAGRERLAAVAAKSRDCWRWCFLGSIARRLALFTPLVAACSRRFNSRPIRSFDAADASRPASSTRRNLARRSARRQPPTPAGETPPWIDQEFRSKSGAINRWMIEARVRLFGRWSLNSLCGRDELGRDLLARLFGVARISLMAGLVGALVSLIIGVSYWGDFRLFRRLGRQSDDADRRRALFGAVHFRRDLS